MGPPQPWRHHRSIAVYAGRYALAEGLRYIQPGLALVLVFVGVKMAIADWVKIPVLLSLAVIVLLIGGSIAASLWRTRTRSSQGVLAQPSRRFHRHRRRTAV